MKSRAQLIVDRLLENDLDPDDINAEVPSAKAWAGWARDHADEWLSQIGYYFGKAMVTPFVEKVFRAKAQRQAKRGDLSARAEKQHRTPGLNWLPHALPMRTEYFSLEDYWKDVVDAYNGLPQQERVATGLSAEAVADVEARLNYMANPDHTPKDEHGWQKPLPYPGRKKI